MAANPGLEFEGYFQAIADNFGRSSNFYTLTDVQDKPHFYDMGLMVQTLQIKQPEGMPFAEKQNVETRNFASLLKIIKEGGHGFGYTHTAEFAKILIFSRNSTTEPGDFWIAPSNI
jgi:hypothetical protein